MTPLPSLQRDAQNIAKTLAAQLAMRPELQALADDAADLASHPLWFSAPSELLGSVIALQADLEIFALTYPDLQPLKQIARDIADALLRQPCE